jgi:hypothetical protein
MINEKHKFLILNILGAFFLLLGILAISNSLYIKNPMQIFWMCYISLLIIGVGILTRNSFLIMSQVYILAIPVLIWNVDFLYQLIFQKPLWGLTNYFFYDRALNLGKFISLQHLYTVPIALYMVHLIGLKRRDAWKWSFVQTFFVYVAVSLLTTAETNINCVFNPCINIYFGIPYRLTWFLIFFTMIFVTAILVIKLPFLQKMLEKHGKKLQK